MTGNQQDFNNAMSQGHTAAWDQNWEEAAGYYRQALQVSPEHPQALNALGLALFELGRYEEALICYQMSARVANNDPIPHEKIAEICGRLGRVSEAVSALIEAAELHLKNRDVDKAVENWRKAITLEPEHLAARTRLAIVYERMGRRNEAATEYLAVAGLLQRTGNQEKALQAVERARQLLPDHAEPEQALARVRSRQPLARPLRQPAAAPSAVIEAAPVPGSVDDSGRFQDIVSEARQNALAHLAEILFEQVEESGLSESAGRDWVRLKPAEKRRAMQHLGQAIQFQTQGQRGQAAAELEEVLKIGLDAPSVVFNLGLLQFDLGHEWAMNNLRKAAQDPDYALASYLLMAQLYEKKRNFAEAAVAYLQALRLADAETVPPEQAENLRQRYESIIADVRRQKDVAALQQLCDHISEQLLRSDWRAQLKAARQSLPTQAEDSAPLPLVELLLHTSSGQAIEAMGLIRKLTGQGLYRSAMEEAFYALQNAPAYLPLHIEIADLLIKEGRLQEAVQKYLQVAELYRLRGEVSEAVRVLGRGAQLVVVDRTIHQRLIDLLTAQGRFDEAIQQYLELARVHYRLGELKWARQTYAEALRLAQRSKSGSGLVVKILHSIADIDQQQLDLTQALKMYHHILGLAPGDENARAQLVQLNFRLGQDGTALAELDELIALFENSGRLERAAQLLDEWIAEWPDKLELRRKLADVYLRRSQPTQAVQQLDALADRLLTAGDRQGAIAMLKEIIALGPENVHDYQEALQRLQAM